MKSLEYKHGDILEVKSEDLKQGDIYKIGTEQWLCLYADHKHALFVSLLLLDVRSFDICDYGHQQYENGSIKKYLNHNFLIYNFKRNFLPLIENGVFLLSREEVNLYFNNQKDKKAYDKFHVNESWWLRDQSDDFTKAYFVNQEGEVSSYPLGHHCTLGLRPAFWMKMNERIDYSKINVPRYANKEVKVDKPFVGMDEKEIGNTKCGPYYNVSLFSNYHFYSWMSHLDCCFLQVSVQLGKVTHVLEMYPDTHWNEDGAPIYEGILFN